MVEPVEHPSDGGGVGLLTVEGEDACYPAHRATSRSLSSRRLMLAARPQGSPRSGGRQRVSIVTPSLDQGAFVAAAIESVLAQDVSELEHIVVEGGSTDGTLEVLARYPHLKVLRDPGHGQSHA